jgi:protein arginine N-methyltransferase 7
MRVRCRRFPPIEKDMRMVLSHCGSLFLDPEALADVFRDLVVLEFLHLLPDFSRFASVDAIAKKPLQLG